MLNVYRVFHQVFDGEIIIILIFGSCKYIKLKDNDFEFAEIFRTKERHDMVTKKIY